jgi:prepilin-type N-terminal cleavage/methylation domain-containing protein
MKNPKQRKHAGFSLLELMIAMTIMLVLLGLVSTLFSGSLGIRSRESRKTDALTASQAALNVMSREIANSGFGLKDNSGTITANNGLIVADSNDHRIHVRANLTNVSAYGSSAGTTTDPGEDVTYYFDSDTSSIVRYDPNGSPQTSVIVNKISNVTFAYFDYAGNNVVTGPATVPTANTGRIEITVEVALEDVQGQPKNQKVKFTSQVNLRNSSYMLSQY